MHCDWVSSARIASRLRFFQRRITPLNFVALLAALLLLDGARLHAQVDSLPSLYDSALPAGHDFSIGLMPINGNMYLMTATQLDVSASYPTLNYGGAPTWAVAQSSFPLTMRPTSASYTASNFVDTMYVVGTRGALSSYDPVNNLVKSSCTLSFTFSGQSNLVYSPIGGLYLATNGFLYSINPSTCAFTQVGPQIGGNVYLISAPNGGLYAYDLSNRNSCSTSTTQACFPFAVYSVNTTTQTMTQVTTDPFSGLPLQTTVTLPFGQFPGQIAVGPQDGLVYFETHDSTLGWTGQGYAFDPVYGTLLYDLSSTTSGAGAGGKMLQGLITLDSNYLLSFLDGVYWHAFNIPNPPSQAVGSANVCPQGGSSPAPCSQTVAIDYDFSSPGIVVPTMTSSGGDFTLDSGSTCHALLTNYTDPVTGMVYRPHCTAYVNFAPAGVGTRTALLQFKNSAGTVLAQTYLSGTGQAPVIAFYQGQQDATFVGASIAGIALDGAGDVFTADPNDNLVVKIAPGGAKTTVGTGLSSPQDVAVDSGGNVYIADAGNNRVVMVAAGTGTQTTVGTNLSNPTAVTVDVSGNVYIGDGGSNSVFKVTGGSQSTVNVTGLGSITSLAADTNGNLYIADSTNQQVVEVLSGGGQANIGSSWGAPSGVFVDGLNNLWVTDAGSNTVEEFGVRVFDGAWSAPRGVAVDANGDVFVADAGGGWVVELPASGSGTPIGVSSLTFAPTPVGETSTDSPLSVTVANVGTEPLTGFYYMLGVGPASFEQVTVSGDLPDCSPNLTIAPGASCNLSIGFVPQVEGSITSDIGFSDNAINGGGLQTLTLNGVGEAPSVTWPAASAITYGQTLASSTLTGGSASVSGTFAFTAPGTAPLTGTQAESVTFKPTNSAYKPVSGTVSVLVNPAPVIISVEPAASSITDGQTLASSTLTGGTAVSSTTNATVPGTFAFATPSTQPSAGKSSQSVTFTPTDAVDYLPATGSVIVQVASLSVAKPTITPGPGTYFSAQSVAILDSTSGATIYYTTDGSIPTTSSAVYNSTNPISVSVNTTIKAVAVEISSKSSYVAATYTLRAAAPTFSVNSGTYFAPQQVSLADATSGANIWYTTDNSTPVAGQGTAVQYTGTPIAVNQNTTIKAIAAVTGWTPSNASSATYTVETGSPTPPFMTSPTPGSTLTAPSQTFTWDPGAGASMFQLLVSTQHMGASDVFNSGWTSSTSANVPNIPTNGVNLYVTLFYRVNGVWNHINYLYTEAGSPTPPSMTSPTPGSTLTASSQTFTWNPGAGASIFELLVGTQHIGASDVFNSGWISTTSANVPNIPTTGVNLYVTLYYRINGVWNAINYVYTASGTPRAPSITSPAQNSTLGGSAQTFIWDPGTAATAFHLRVGTMRGGNDIYDSGTTSATSANIINIPTTGGTLYVRLMYNIGGTWSWVDYSYIEP